MRIISICLFIALCLTLSANGLLETELQEIELKGDIAISNSELSGMTWYEDHLILMPQYPNFPSYEGEGRLFKIGKAQLLEYIVGDVVIPITPDEIRIDYSYFQNNIPGFEGFEAIAFQGNNVYLSIEAEPEKIEGYLIMGTIDDSMTEIVLDTLKYARINPQADVSNASEESILIADSLIMTFYEANGHNINPSPVANCFDGNLDFVKQIEFPSLEFRVTDATLLDENNGFWIINYFWPGEKEQYDPAEDLILRRFPSGETHADTQIVERLMKFCIHDDKIEIEDIPPIQLKLLSEARNLEGITKFDDLGFILCTDKFPRTILGFVPYDFGE